MIVTLEVFSGRPNPRWRLEQEEKDEFLLLLRDLRRINGREFLDELRRKRWGEPPTLGYRGFLLEPLADGAAFKWITVIHDYAFVTDRRDCQEVVCDPDYVLENWLIERSKEQATPELLERIIEERRL